MMLGDFTKAVAQMGDPRFRRVLFLGLGLTVGLLLAASLGTSWVVGALFPDVITLPFFGDVTVFQSIASGLSLVAVLGLSVFLMVPVASAFTGLFLDEVADAVEARHYPGLPAARTVSIATSIADSLKFLGVILVANVAALVLYLLFPPFAPLIFWGLNGFLLGREYFQMVALRRLPAPDARRLARKHMPQIWLAGCLLAIPLTIPLVNLLIPILGAASFTHLFQRLKPAASAP
ncbi:hypothetical protein BV911_06245 [Pseudoruegeria sp. SK021]|nr:hypothetical protein BV911_06245 [Pseudoruegeria sp. SK021]